MSIDRPIHSFHRLRRIPSQGWVAGVLAGLAEYFDWNVKVLRVVCAVALFCTGFFPIGFVYCVLWYVLDRDDAPSSRRGSSDDPPPRDYDPSPRYYRSRREPDVTDVKVRFARLEERLRGMEECVASKDFELRRELRKLES
ncbi:MAG TPA: PspC domain-containing protein [Nevskiaceae bacterium]|nr:PspC domain-containing protein [Nevskiaceae bacterium]